MDTDVAVGIVEGPEELDVHDALTMDGIYPCLCSVAGNNRATVEPHLVVDPIVL